MGYTVIVEEDWSSRGAYTPNLPGCIAAGESREEALQLIRESIEFRSEGLRKRIEPIPEFHLYGELVEVDAA